jgi:hypothetical protein
VLSKGIHSPRRRPASLRSSPSAWSSPRDHVLQLFDTDESLTRSVAAFLHNGRGHGEALLIVATKQHWNGISSRLRVLEATGTRHRPGAEIFWDAEETLGRFMRRGEAHRPLFAQSVAKAVRGLTLQAPEGLRIYGEMVELLAQEANYTAAAQLEQLWNELGRQIPFTLLCGYSAAHFAGPDGGAALPTICCEHSHSTSRRSDLLGRFLLDAEHMRHSAAADSR